MIAYAISQYDCMGCRGIPSKCKHTAEANRKVMITYMKCNCKIGA